jgi:hypothetical protein
MMCLISYIYGQHEASVAVAALYGGSQAFHGRRSRFLDGVDVSWTRASTMRLYAVSFVATSNSFEDPLSTWATLCTFTARSHVAGLELYLSYVNDLLTHTLT